MRQCRMQVRSFGAAIIYQADQRQMMSNDKQNDNAVKGKDHLVTITIDGNPYSVTRGEHTVVELKGLAGIPLADDLDEIKEKKPHPLKDDGKTNIKGGEVFVSHPKGSGSSHN
jgi:hypothetical protein